MDDDEPMDLLQGVASRVTSKSYFDLQWPLKLTLSPTDASLNKRRKPGQEASRFKTDDDTGKMVIDSDDSDEETSTPQQKPKEDVVGTAYRESITSVDGFTRGPNGRIKFNKDTKKRRREAQEAEDDAMDVEENPKKQRTKQSNSRPGQEFKAKRAGGDIKKNGVDPYAYVTLSQAAGKKGGRKNQIGIAGKGSRK
ncbi:pre-rRNA processing protein [Marasmius sp. AFHP31]|nr:pre-rRNA processing protein [Marasmius sp. AFHP31]